MSQPLPYERDFDFEGFQSGHPSTPLPGDKVNLEFDQVAETLDQVLDRIARLQRDDLELANASVGLDQLKPEISFGAGAASTAVAAAASATAAAAAAQAAASSAATSAASISSTAYNAVHDGGANNSGLATTGAALQAGAIAAAAAGKPFLIPDGDYLFGPAEYLNPPDGLHIIGAPGAVFIRANDVILPLIYKPAVSVADDLRIEGLGFLYTAGSTTVSGSNCAIYIVGATNTIIRDCDVNGAFYVGINTSDCTDITIEENRIAGFVNRGVYANAGQGGTTAGPAKHLRILNNHIDGLGVANYGINTNGFGTATGDNVLIEGNTIVNVISHGISASERIAQIKIALNHVESTQPAVVGIIAQKANTFRGGLATILANTIVGCFNGLVVTECDYVDVVANIVSACSNIGVYVHDSKFVSFVATHSLNNVGSGFLVDGTAPSDSQYISFAACVATGNTGYGLSIDANVLNPAIDNTCTFLTNTAGNENINSATMRRGTSGPQLVTDNALVRWDAATGSFVQNSVAILSDTGVLTGLAAAVAGHTASLTFAGVVNAIQAFAATFTGAVIGCFSSTASDTGLLTFYRSLSGVVGNATVVASGTMLGKIIWLGAQQTGTFGTQSVAASIRAEVDGTVTSGAVGDMPGRLIFSTALDGGTGGETDRMKIDNQGFVNVMGGSFGRAAAVTKTVDFTVARTENYLINNKAAATCTVTLPAAATFNGREITIKNIQAFTVVSASANVVPMAGGAATTAILAATAGKWATLVSDGTNWEIMAGN